VEAFKSKFLPSLMIIGCVFVAAACNSSGISQAQAQSDARNCNAVTPVLDNLIHQVVQTQTQSTVNQVQSDNEFLAQNVKSYSAGASQPLHGYLVELGSSSNLVADDVLAKTVGLGGTLAKYQSDWNKFVKAMTAVAKQCNAESKIAN
jgi:hypothetical protein